LEKHLLLLCLFSFLLDPSISFGSLELLVVFKLFEDALLSEFEFHGCSLFASLSYLGHVVDLGLLS